MALVLADAGATVMLNRYFLGTIAGNSLALAAGAVPANNFVLKLYTNNYIPVDTSTASSFTQVVEANAGYASKELTAANFVVATVNNIVQVSYPQLTFTFTGALTANATIYGYYVINSDGILVYAEKAAIPFTPISNGDSILVTPIFQLSKGTPT